MNQQFWVLSHQACKSSQPSEPVGVISNSLTSLLDPLTLFYHLFNCKPSRNYKNETMSMAKVISQRLTTDKGSSLQVLDFTLHMDWSKCLITVFMTSQVHRFTNVAWIRILELLKHFIALHLLYSMGLRGFSLISLYLEDFTLFRLYLTSKFNLNNS